MSFFNFSELSLNPLYTIPPCAHGVLPEERDLLFVRIVTFLPFSAAVIPRTHSYDPPDDRRSGDGRILGTRSRCGRANPADGDL